MKLFIRFVLLFLFIISFGALFVFYLYLHKENKVELIDITQKGTKKFKTVKRKIEKRNKEMEIELNQRQKEMQDFLKGLEKDTFEIKSLAERFVNVSTRTLRRDLAKLEKSGLVKQLGKTKDTLYQVLND